MAAPPEEYSYQITVEDVDKALLPADARTPGTDAFRVAVTRLIEKDYASFGGYVRIVVSDATIQVYWRSDPKAPDPMGVALRKLREGEYEEGVRLLEYFRLQQPDNMEVLYNLGLALSDLGRLQEAEKHLRRAVVLAPTDTNALVGLGVALIRQGRSADAVEVLKHAVAQSPDNLWAQRNLGACLLKLGHKEEAEKCFRGAVEINPTDQQSVFGLAQALEANGNPAEADPLYIKVIEMDSRSPVADAARDARSILAQTSFRGRAPGVARPDAVMYLLGALRKFGRMSRAEIQKIGFEIAIMGQRGLDTNDSAQKYRLQSLPGQYSGLHLVCMMHVAFQIIAPDDPIGFDLSKEFKVAKEMYDGKQKEGTD